QQLRNRHAPVGATTAARDDSLAVDHLDHEVVDARGAEPGVDAGERWIGAAETPTDDAGLDLIVDRDALLLALLVLLLLLFLDGEADDVLGEEGAAAVPLTGVAALEGGAKHDGGEELLRGCGVGCLATTLSNQGEVRLLELVCREAAVRQT